MENKEKLINEIHRNLQLMEVGLVNEQKEFIKKVFKNATEYFKPPKLNLIQKLDDLIKNNDNIRSIVENPNAPNDEKQKKFKAAYTMYMYDKDNLMIKHDLIYSFLDLEKEVTLLEKTDFLLRGLNISYSQLSSYLANLANIKNIDINSVINYFNSIGITDTDLIKIYTRYYNIYSRYGSGRSKGLVQKGSINKLIDLAKQENFFELISFWTQTYKSFYKTLTKNKSDLEIKILDKYAGYCDDLGRITDNTKIEQVTIAYKKYIDNTYRLYLMQQDKASIEYIYLFAEQIKNSTNPNAESLSKIIDELKMNTLGEKYPGFRLTAILNSSIDGKSNFQKDLFLLGKAISPDYGHIYSGIVTKILPPKLKLFFQNKYVSRIIRTQMWGVFPNTELLYRLISKSKTSIKNKQYKVLLILYLQYVLYNMARNCILFIYIPVSYGLWTLFVKNPIQQNYPELFGPLTTEQQDRLRGEWSQDVATIFTYEFKNHILKTFLVVDKNEQSSFPGKILNIAVNMITPAELTSFNNSIMANIGLWLGNKGLGEGATDYKSFSSLIFNSVIKNFKNVLVGIIEGAKAATSQTQAGGTEVTVNTPTWSYTTAVTFPNVKFIDINFRHDKTKNLIVNGVNIDNFSNVGNKVRFSIRSSTRINSVKIIDTNDVTHDIRQQ